MSFPDSPQTSENICNKVTDYGFLKLNALTAAHSIWMRIAEGEVNSKTLDVRLPVKIEQPCL